MFTKPETMVNGMRQHKMTLALPAAPDRLRPSRWDSPPPTPPIVSPPEFAVSQSMQLSAIPWWHWTRMRRIPKPSPIPSREKATESHDTSDAQDTPDIEIVEAPLPDEILLEVAKASVEPWTLTIDAMRRWNPLTQRLESVNHAKLIGFPQVGNLRSVGTLFRDEIDKKLIEQFDGKVTLHLHGASRATDLFKGPTARLVKFTPHVQKVTIQNEPDRYGMVHDKDLGFKATTFPCLKELVLEQKAPRMIVPMFMEGISQDDVLRDIRVLPSAYYHHAPFILEGFLTPRNRRLVGKLLKRDVEVYLKVRFLAEGWSSAVVFTYEVDDRRDFGLGFGLGKVYSSKES